MAVLHTDITNGQNGSIFSGLFALITRMTESHPLARQIEALNAHSDEELAEKGLTRQDALRHIFRGRYYI